MAWHTDLLIACLCFACFASMRTVYDTGSGGTPLFAIALYTIQILGATVDVYKRSAEYQGR